MKGEVGYGNYWTHLKVAFYSCGKNIFFLNFYVWLQSGWSKRNHPNLKFIWYEEMKKDHLKVLRELCEFTGNNDYTNDQLEKLRDHLTIDSMRNVAMNENENEASKEGSRKFFRKGQVGDWKNYFAEEKMMAAWNKWIEENLQNTDITMDFE